MGRRRFPVWSPREAADRPKKRKSILNGAGTGYNFSMMFSFAVFAMKVLEIMFFVGLIGSSVVVLISFVEDGRELFGKDEPVPPRS